MERSSNGSPHKDATALPRSLYAGVSFATDARSIAGGLQALSKRCAFLNPSQTMPSSSESNAPLQQGRVEVAPCGHVPGLEGRPGRGARDVIRSLAQSHLDRPLCQCAPSGSPEEPSGCPHRQGAVESCWPLGGCRDGRGEILRERRCVEATTMLSSTRDQRLSRNRERIDAYGTHCHWAWQTHPGKRDRRRCSPGP